MRGVNVFGHSEIFFGIGFIRAVEILFVVFFNWWELGILVNKKWDYDGDESVSFGEMCYFFDLKMEVICPDISNGSLLNGVYG